MDLVQIEISKNMSIVDVKADYVILKNAKEGLFGPESAINKALGGTLAFYNNHKYTKSGTTKLLDNLEGIAANGIILVGISNGFQMRYETLGMMIANSIELLAEKEKKPISIATVSHGVGFGLERQEVFYSQIFNFKTALEKNRKNLIVEKIIFNELSTRDGLQLKNYLSNLAVQDDSSIIVENDKYYLKLGDTWESAEIFDTRITEARYVFVAMPFAEEFENVYDFGIALPIEENNLLPIRTDKEHFMGSIVEEIKKRIKDSFLVIADVTKSNPNVLYELGYAEGLGKPNIIISQSGEELPFDIRGLNILFYNPLLLRELNGILSEAINKLSSKNGF